MKEIIEAYLGFFFLCLISVTSISMISAAIDNSNAHSYHDAIISEIEEYHFASSTINALGNAAVGNGYSLEVEINYESGPSRVFVYNKNRKDNITKAQTENVSYAKVSLGFDYSFRLVNMVSSHVIKGIAR